MEWLLNAKNYLTMPRKIFQKSRRNTRFIRHFEYKQPAMSRAMKAFPPIPILPKTGVRTEETHRYKGTVTKLVPPIINEDALFKKLSIDFKADVAEPRTSVGGRVPDLSGEYEEIVAQFRHMCSQNSAENKETGGIARNKDEEFMKLLMADMPKEPHETREFFKAEDDELKLKSNLNRSKR